MVMNLLNKCTKFILKTITQLSSFINLVMNIIKINTPSDKNIFYIELCDFVMELDNYL